MLLCEGEAAREREEERKRFGKIIERESVFERMRERERKREIEGESEGSREDEERQSK